MLRRFILIIIILTLIVAGLYFGIRSLVNTKRQNEQVSQTISEQLATSSANSANNGGQNELENLIPTSTTTVPTSWGSHNFGQPSTQFNISYPPNLIVSNNSDASSTIIVLAFPKENYFHWPLQDDVRITITVSSSCADPMVPQNPSTATTTFSSNGYSFTAIHGNDVAAGNLYHEILYTTEVNNQCYSFSFFDHGSNGAGLYVDDPVLIQKYDSQHSADYSQAVSVFDSIVTSFKSVL